MSGPATGGRGDGAAAAAAPLGRSTAVMAAGTLLSRVTGLGRVFALAYALGATRLTDTYLLANNTPNIIYELVLGGLLSGTLVTVFVRELRQGDDEDAWTAVSAVTTLAVVASVALAALFVAVAPLFIRLYTLRNRGEVAADQLAVATTLLRLFAPQVLFYGLITVSTALLNARRRFAAPMFAPVLNNLVVIGVLLAFPHVARSTELAGVRGDTRALLLLGLGTTAGVAAMALAQLPRGLVGRRPGGGRRLRWVWDPRHPAVRTIVRLSGWTAGFVAANQVALFVVQFLANDRAGDVAVYMTAYIFFLLPHGIVSVSIATAIAPELAERWAAGDRAGFRSRLSLGLRSIAAVTVPAAAGYVLLARPVVAIALEHGALRRESAEDIAATLAVMALGLPAFSCWLFVTRAYQALQDTRSLFFLYVVENGVNVVAALALYPALGVRGLALAFALAYATGLAAALAHLRRRTGGLDGRAVAASLARIGAAAAAMTVAVAVIAAFVGRPTGTGALVRVAFAVPAGVTVYLVAAWALGVAETRALLNVRRRPSRTREGPTER